MNDTKKERELLLEMREHTIDCDWNRWEHFYSYNRLIKKVKYIHATEAILLFLLLLYYILSATWPTINTIKRTSIIPIILSIIALCVQMIDFYTNYSERADHHWTAAQAYSRLYRECQFFPVHYANISTGELTRILHDICNELHDLNTLSPNVDQKAYKKAGAELKNKKYPVDRLLDENDNKVFDDVVNKLKHVFKDYIIEIYVYGSYVKKIIYNDIDLAVIVYGEINNYEADLKAAEVEKMFKEIPFDITVISESELQDNEEIPLLRNIQLGKCLFRSPEITIGLQQQTFVAPNYSVIIKKYLNKINENSNDVGTFLENAYNCYYYIIASILESSGKTWDGESSLITEFKKVSFEEDYENLFNQFMLLRKERNKGGSLLDFSGEFREKTISEIELYLNK